MNAGSPELAAFIERYVAMWNEPGPVRRRSLIEGLWTADGANFTRAGEYRGHDALEARVRIAHEKWVRDGNCLFHTRSFDSHHGAVRFTWEMVSTTDGKVISVGLEFLALSGDGRIREDYQFIEPSA